MSTVYLNEGDVITIQRCEHIIRIEAGKNKLVMERLVGGLK